MSSYIASLYLYHVLPMKFRNLFVYQNDSKHILYEEIDDGRSIPFGYKKHPTNLKFYVKLLKKLMKVLIHKLLWAVNL